MTEKIEEIVKDSREVHRILLLILLRSWADRMSRCDVGSFEWDVIPKFMQKGTILEPKILILG